MNAVAKVTTVNIGLIFISDDREKFKNTFNIYCVPTKMYEMHFISPLFQNYERRSSKRSFFATRAALSLALMKNSSAFLALTKILCNLFAPTLKVKECVNFFGLTQFKVCFENKIIFPVNLC